MAFRLNRLRSTAADRARLSSASAAADVPAAGGGVDRATFTHASARLAAPALVWRGVIPVALYLLAGVAALLRLGSHPGYAYNWETYTAWRFFPFWDNPSAAIFDLTDGLMTDSGLSPLIALPAWLGFSIDGVGLTALRTPVALIAALAAPLTWLVGRRLVSPPVASIAAVLLALSPAYLLYARTATLVGISLAPALLSIYALIRVLRQPKDWRWLAAFQVLLILNSYAYAPVRFLWPIGVGLLAGEFLWRRGERRGFLLALLVTTAVLPAALVLLDQDPGHDPRDAVAKYFNGRGEQILALNDAPDGYEHYLRLTPEKAAAGAPAGTPTELATRLILQNAKDLGNLLIDRGTRPALIDYWNPHGRLYPWFLVPFFVLGTGASLRRIRRRVEDRALLALVCGFSLPMLLTSQVHIGRLIFAIPFLFLFVASGMIIAAGWLTTVAHRVAPRLDRRLLPAGMTVALLVVSAWVGWRDYRAAPAPTHDTAVIAQLLADAPMVARTTGSAALVRGGLDQVEIEAITVAGYRLALDRHYRFVNLATADGPAFDEAAGAMRPSLFFGGLLARLSDPAAMPAACETVYFVEPFVLDQFFDLGGERLSTCASIPSIVSLPD